jgi:glycosyltransferase involved in cell wall biosynthesis
LLTAKRIIFISNSIVPLKDAGGGSVVVYRHLKRLKNEGYQVVVIYLNSLILGGQHDDAFEYVCVSKKNWHPPLRRKTPLLTKIRILLTFKYLTKIFRFNPDTDLILGILGEVSNLLLLQIRRKLGIPFYMFFHDDFIFNEYAFENLLTRKNVNEVLKHSCYIFPVSDPLTNILLEKGINNAARLYPIPEGYTGTGRAQFVNKGQGLNLLTAGTFGPVHFDILKKIGQASNSTNSKFYCVTDLPLDLQGQLTSGGNVSYVPRFQTTSQLFDYILKSIDILIVFYSFNVSTEPRLLTSFPSKFIEYCHLGLPIILIAPQQSSLGKWAVLNNWLCYINNDEPSNISQQIEKLKDAVYWESSRQQSLLFAKNDFNPDLIHEQFVNCLQLQY